MLLHGDPTRDPHVTLGGDARVADDSSHDGWGLRRIGEGLAAQHDVVGVEDVGDQRDRAAEDLGALGQDVAGGLVPVACSLVNLGDLGDLQARRTCGGDDPGVAGRGLELAGAMRVEQRRRTDREVPDDRRASTRVWTEPSTLNATPTISRA